MSEKVQFMAEIFSRDGFYFWLIQVTHIDRVAVLECPSPYESHDLAELGLRRFLRQLELTTDLEIRKIEKIEVPQNQYLH